jgi:hypothetical protein
MRWFARVAVAALVLLEVPSAGAQQPLETVATQRWLVVPALDGERAVPELTGIEAVHPAAEAFRTELVLRGESTHAAHRASEQFEALGSAPAPEVSQRDIDRWVERSRAAVRHLARADYKAARRELKAAQHLSTRAAEELNREATRAQQVLDTCLFMVRAYVETHKPEEARRQARECRQLVPRVEPSAFRHTPEVRDLLADVDAQMASEAPGTVAVTSDPADCLFRINGVEIGRTPIDGIELPVGLYRMQVECDPNERGRIHRVRVASGNNRLSFDGALERAVHTRPVLHLRYASTDAWGDRMAHAADVNAVLGGGRELVVSSLGRGTLRIDSNGDGLEPASVWIPATASAPDADDVTRALDALLAGRSVDFTGPHPLARAGWQAKTPEATPRPANQAPATPVAVAAPQASPRPREQRVAGWTLFGLGVASVGASVGLHVWRGELGERFLASPASLSDANRWNDARIAVWTTAAFGGAAASSAMPLFLPERPRTPWWGWTLGALGLGLSGYAIYEGITMTSCPEPFISDETAVRACVARGQEAGRISLALAGAAPLLTVPLVYLIRPLRAEPSVSVSTGGAVVQLRKAF